MRVINLIMLLKVTSCWSQLFSRRGRTSLIGSTLKLKM